MRFYPEQLLMRDFDDGLVPYWSPFENLLSMPNIADNNRQPNPYCDYAPFEEKKTRTMNLMFDRSALLFTILAHYI